MSRKRKTRPNLSQPNRDQSKTAPRSTWIKPLTIDSKSYNESKSEDPNTVSWETNNASPPKEIVSGLRPTNETGNNPKDRWGLAKVPFSMLPLPSLVFMAMAMKGGAQDYGPQNYRVEKVQARVYLDAALRHLLALMDGEDIDPKRGIHHGGFIMATTGIYLDAMVHGNLVDNRVIPGPTGQLIGLFNDLPGQTATPEELHQRFQTFMSTVNKG